MRRHCPTLSSLVAFEAAARSGSLSRAAEGLCLTQGAVSKQVRQLESFLGVAVFERQRHGLALTDAGRRYLDEIQPALQRIEAASLAAGVQPDPDGVLQISCMPTLAARWLIPALPAFFAQHPRVRLSFVPHRYGYDFSEAAPDAAIRPDAAFRYGDGHWPDGESDYVIGRDVVAVARPGLVASPVRGPAALLRYPLLHHTSALEAWDDWMREAGCPTVRADQGAQFDQFSLLTEAAVAGMGIGLIPHCLVAEELRDGRLVTVVDGEFSTRRGYYLCCRPARASEPALRAFRVWLQRRALADGIPARSPAA